jgi:Domain of unknown function (DUF4136)
MKLTVASCVVLLALTTGLAGQAKYVVKATTAEHVDFEKFETYSWTTGKPSHNKEVDAWIVAAVDRELSALGLRKTTLILGDILATYDSASRADSEQPGQPEVKGGPPPRWVGGFIVSLLDSGNSRRPLLRLRLDRPIDVEPSQLHPEIDHVVMEMFAKYPGRREK